MKRGGSLFFFDDFHFCRSRVIGLDMTENRIFTLCHMITWVVFLRMFWNKRGGSLSFLVGTISNVLVMEIGWTEVGSGGYILVSCAHSNASYIPKSSNQNAVFIGYDILIGRFSSMNAKLVLKIFMAVTSGWTCFFALCWIYSWTQDQWLY